MFKNSEGQRKCRGGQRVGRGHNTYSENEGDQFQGSPVSVWWGSPTSNSIPLSPTLHPTSLTKGSQDHGRKSVIFRVFSTKSLGDSLGSTSTFRWNSLGYHLFVASQAAILWSQDFMLQRGCSAKAGRFGLSSVPSSLLSFIVLTSEHRCKDKRLWPLL